MWLIGVLLLLVLLIPVVSIVVDGPLGRALARRLEGRATAPPELGTLASRVEALEAELDDMSRAVESLREETAFLQRLLEDGPSRPPLPPGRS